MPKPELTKTLLADTLKKLMAAKPLNKISVGEIVDKAGLNRQTFYYHFADKQELVCWIFDTDVEKLTDKNQNSTIIDDVADYMYSERKFYISALTSEAQNSLSKHIYNICYDRITDKILLVLGNKEMDKEMMALFIRLFTNALVGSLVQWAQEGMKTNVYYYNEDFAPAAMDCLEYIISKYAKG